MADNADNDENADNGIQEVAGERSNPIQANALGIFNTTATFVVIIAFQMTNIFFDFRHLYLAGRNTSIWVLTSFVFLTSFRFMSSFAFLNFFVGLTSLDFELFWCLMLFVLFCCLTSLVLCTL